ncbi:reverse transcriptase domain-containing protein [Tanacetum coccineum]
MLERLVGHEYYCFLDGFSGYFQIPIALEDQEKATFTCPYGTFAYKRMPFELCNAPATFQRCMIAIFYELIEDNMEVFRDDFSIFGNSFDHCLKNLEKMLKRCEETNLVLNWEKCHFMVKEGIVLSHKDLIMIKPDWSLPFKVICDASDYAVCHLGNPLFSDWTELQDKELRAMMQSLERKKDLKTRMKSLLLLTEETQAQDLKPSPFSYK